MYIGIGIFMWDPTQNHPTAEGKRNCMATYVTRKKVGHETVPRKQIHLPAG